MKRIIKFRGKRLDNGEWCYGSLLQEQINGAVCECIIIDHIYAREKKQIQVNTACQFTGFYDADGREVYEGDIVSLKGSSVTATVEWSGYAFHFFGLEDVSGRRPDYLPSPANQMRVIGNIYEKKGADK